MTKSLYIFIIKPRYISKLEHSRRRHSLCSFTEEKKCTVCPISHLIVLGIQFRFFRKNKNYKRLNHYKKVVQ